MSEEIVLLIIFNIFSIWVAEKARTVYRIRKLDKYIQDFERHALDVMKRTRELIEIKYELLDIKLEVDLNKKGFKQLDYIYRDINILVKRLIVQNLKDTKLKTELELSIIWADESYETVTNSFYADMNYWLNIVDPSYDSHGMSYIYNNAIDEYKKDARRRLDIILNGDLSHYLRQ